VCAAQVTDEHPADQDQPFPRLVPVARTADGFHVAPPAAVPGHVQPGASRAGHRLLRRRQLGPLLAGPARRFLALDHGRRLIQPGVFVELADQAQPAAPVPGEAGRLVRVVVAVSGQHETPLPLPTEQRTTQLPQQVLRCLVPFASLEVVLLAAVQRHQQRQGPRPFGEGQADQHGQHHPLVAPAEGSERVAGADRVAVAGLAEDLVAWVFGDRVVTGQQDTAFRHEVVKDPTAKAAGQPPAGPAPFGEDFVVAGGVAGGQGAEGAQQVADGTTTDGEDGGQGQDDHAQEGGPGEGTSQGVEEGARRPGQGLVGAAELAAGGAGLARLALAAFAVAAPSTAGLATARGRPAALATRRRAAPRGSGYTGHGSLLDVYEGGGSTFIAPSRLLLCDPSQKGQKSR
jgi:hypothetical protein